jgi:RNA recognition motif-containing protein
MQAKLYVGNLNFEVTEDDLHRLFAKFGDVKTVTIIKDLYTQKSKGFGFVEMSTSQEAEKALEQNGQEFMGRAMTVSEARPQKKDFGGRRSGGGGFGRDRDRGGYRGGRNRY